MNFRKLYKGNLNYLQLCNHKHLNPVRIIDHKVSIKRVFNNYKLCHLKNMVH
jgi:hypothetical protein